ncbi:EAL domain-containing protein [Vibrio owensii]|uniref:EAL domain-containing protein n=1 Tax=Vibrio owensii TaxID=696485 RepID=UPI003AB095CB
MNLKAYCQPKIKPHVGTVSYESFVRSKKHLDIESFVLNQKDKIKFDLTMLELFSNAFAEYEVTNPVSINVFSNSFYSDVFIKNCERIVNNFKFNLEITEHEKIHDLKKAKEAMIYLQELGIECSLDDFGKGYSTASTLKNLPFREVKIDKSLVRQVCDSKSMRERLKCIKRMACDLGIGRVVYEGIESQTLEDIILNLDNDAIFQGYFYARPKPINEVFRLNIPTQVA